MSKLKNYYLRLISLIFFSTVLMNIREVDNVLYIFHPYNIILLFLGILGFYLSLHSESLDK